MRDSTRVVPRSFVRGVCWLLPGLMPLVLLAATGCGSGEPPTADDEAMRRARAEGLSPREAAERYFYPRHIEDYFEGMDAIAPHASVRTDPMLDGDDLSQITAAIRSSGRPDDEQNDRPTPVLDHAALTGPAAPPALSRSEVLGRNTWMIWCGGNEGFWDWLATDSLGFIDLLKLLDSRNRRTRFRDAGLINEPGMTAAAGPRQDEFGLWLDVPASRRLRDWRAAYVESTFAAIGDGTHSSQRGLPQGRNGGRLPRNDEGYAAPGSYVTGESGSSYGAAGDYGTDGSDDAADPYRDVPPPDVYGLSSGVVGLRLFPNPKFDAVARAAWDAERYYNDESYFADPNLVRPYRVGMSCAFCHASFHPLNPPLDPANPEWANISGNIGAQYLRIRAVFGNLLDEEDFVYHLLDSQPPGTIDTSLIASDNINNPNTMNAIFGIPERALLALRNPREPQSGASRTLPNLWEVPARPDDDDQTANRRTIRNRSVRTDVIPQELADHFRAQGLEDELAASNRDPRFTPRILLDGADSIGAWGAFARVYLNIGTYYERWNQLHQPVLGFEPQKPFTIRDCDDHSVYWHATNLRVAGLRDYFLKITPSMRLLSAPGGQSRLRVEPASVVAEREGRSEQEVLATTIDVTKLAHGRQVFAQNCIVCHSSIQPESSAWTLYPERLGSNVTAEQRAAAKSRREAYNARYAALIRRREELRQEWADNGEYWDHDPGQWLADTDYRTWAAEIVDEPAFWDSNYLSTDYRIPVTVVGTNAGRALATNAMTGHMWQDFASAGYRQMPSVGPIEYFNPWTGPNGATERFEPRHRVADGVPVGGGGPGFYRVPTLMSIWATAPLLHNNSLGVFNNDPGVDGRLLAFDDAIRKLLWPERRRDSNSYNGATPERLARDRGLIWRTPNETYLTIGGRYLPNALRMFPTLWQLGDRYPWLRNVSPLWLPALALGAVSFALLAVSHRTYRRRTGYVLLLLAAVLGGLLWLAHRYPAWTLLRPVRAIEPWPLPLIVLAAGGGLLLLRLSPRWTRRAGYGALVAAVVVTFGIQFFAGRLGDLRIGPIPAGTPVNLLANVNSEAPQRDIIKGALEVTRGLSDIRSRSLDPKATREVLARGVVPPLMKINKCPDFVMDRGHDFPWFSRMTDDDKHAVIELLKTF